MLADNTDSEVRRKLEQMRGIGYAQHLLDSLIDTMKGEVENKQEEQRE